MTGIGLDLLEIERLDRALARRPRLAERLFTDLERSYAAARVRPAQHLAARFCAKEAVAKALGLTTWDHHDVEVISEGGGPRVRLAGAAAAGAREQEVVPVVSLTHDRTTAAAVALLVPAGAPPSP